VGTSGERNFRKEGRRSVSDRRTCPGKGETGLQEFGRGDLSGGGSRLIGQALPYAGERKDVSRWVANGQDQREGKTRGVGGGFCLEKQSAGKGDQS